MWASYQAGVGGGGEARKRALSPAVLAGLLLRGGEKRATFVSRLERFERKSELQRQGERLRRGGDPPNKEGEPPNKEGEGVLPTREEASPQEGIGRGGGPSNKEVEEGLPNKEGEEGVPPIRKGRQRGSFAYPRLPPKAKISLSAQIKGGDCGTPCYSLPFPKARLLLSPLSSLLSTPPSIKRVVVGKSD